MILEATMEPFGWVLLMILILVLLRKGGNNV